MFIVLGRCEDIKGTLWIILTEKTVLGSRSICLRMQLSVDRQIFGNMFERDINSNFQN